MFGAIDGTLKDNTFEVQIGSMSKGNERYFTLSVSPKLVIQISNPV